VLEWNQLSSKKTVKTDEWYRDDHGQSGREREGKRPGEEDKGVEMRRWSDDMKSTVKYPVRAIGIGSRYYAK
jgi:hypothetical protein